MLTAAHPPMRFHIGTSGWVYPHWRGRFFPRDLPQTEWLAWYVNHFDTVELNRSFYRLPTRENFVAWREATPARFRFAVKASRYLTHLKKLKDPEPPLHRLLEAISGLGPRLGPLLFQLPPRWHLDLERMETFLRALPSRPRAAFELRDPDWHRPELYALLARHHAAVCVYELAHFRSAPLVTTDFLYLRLHGPGERYQGRYGRRGLTRWASWLRDQPVKDAWVYFDNDQAAFAVRDALELRALVE